MSNIKNYNFNQLDLKLSNSDYWDFFLSMDENGNSCVADCAAVWFDFNQNIFPTNSLDKISSLVSWSEAVNTGYTLNTFGLTGIDNGNIIFDKASGDTSNNALLNALTGSTLEILSGDTKYYMNAVTGTTGAFTYPMNLVVDSETSVGNHVEFNGGFYQGYYKLDGYDYQVLPIRTERAWASSFWLKNKANNTTGSTLNNLYPNNKGFFFYMGTRAENKFWSKFSGNSENCASDCIAESGCTESVGQWCTIPKEMNIVLSGSNGVGYPLNPPAVEVSIVTNEFLIYGRARSGTTGTCSSCGGNHDGLGIYNTCTYDGNGITTSKFTEVVTDHTNPFLIYGRAKSGATGSCGSCGGNHDGYGIQTICTYSGDTSLQTQLDYKADIVDNALGFRIKDDGSIGYRLLTITASCVNDINVTGYTIEEAYSVSGVVSNDVWTNIVIRFVSDHNLTECELLSATPRKGRLKIYVNGRLKLVVRDFDEFVARRLSEYKDKQLGVPFNFSLGGGSQGLLESQTFDGQDAADLNLPIQQNFAGTFMGSISQFKFFTCDVTFPNIYNNYNEEKIRYEQIDSNLILTEDGIGLGNEDGFGLLWI